MPAVALSDFCRSRVLPGGTLGLPGSQEWLHGKGSQNYAVIPSSANSVQPEGHEKWLNVSDSAFALDGDLRHKRIVPGTPAKQN